MERFDVKRTLPVVAVNGNPYLLEDARIDRASIPEGLFVYEAADGDSDGCIARVQEGVCVNFLGTLIEKSPIPLKDGAYYPAFGTEEYEGIRIGEMSLDEYLLADAGAFGIVKGACAKDGEYAVFAGRKYTISCVIAPCSNAEWDDFKDDARERLPGFTGAKWLGYERSCREDGSQDLVITILAEEDARAAAIYDVLDDSADRAGMYFEWLAGCISPVRCPRQG